MNRAMSVPPLATPLRKLGRRRRLGAPEAGFAGPGHTAVEVVTPDAFPDNDPFILLMDDRLDFAPGQEVGGAHPHAGFETVTLVLEGALDDRDEGLLHAGDAVWMTAGRGIVHNEHVRATGPARILQLWVTLAEKDRAAPPRFEVIRAADLPTYRAAGVEARLYSGRTNNLSSPTHNHVPVTLIDLRLDPGAVFQQELPGEYNGFLLPLSNSIRVEGDGVALGLGEIGWLERRGRNETTTLRIEAAEDGARVLIYAGEPQNETTLQHGPFVAGSLADLERMFRDYRAGRFARISELARRGRPDTSHARSA